MKRVARWLAGAAVNAGLAGGLVGLIEAVRLGTGEGGGALPSLLLIASGLGALGGVALGVPLLGAAALAARPEWVQAWRYEIETPGEARVAAITRALLAVLALAALAGCAFRLAVWSHGRFNAPGAVGLLHGVAIAVAAAILWFSGRTAAPVAARWLAARPMLTRATSGWAGRALLAAAVGVGLVALGLAYRVAAPAADIRPAITALGFLALLAGSGWIDPAARLGAVVPSGRAIAGAALLAVMVVALVQVGVADGARQRIASRGISSLAVLKVLWASTDRDRDGSPSRFGGGDCDDSSPAIHPGAREIPGNGIDDNCAGGDLTRDMLAFRAEPVPTARPGAPRHSVILISIDAIRADHTSAYGFDRPTTPSLERLAARGTRFDWAITPSPTTRRAIPGMLTGRYASAMTFIESDKDWPPRLKPRTHTLLGESFKRAGYDTKAVLCCTTLFDRRAGVVEGIDHVDATAVKVKKHNGHIVTDNALAYLESRAGASKPFFLWIHYLDAHNPYEQPEGAPVFGSGELDRYHAEIRFVDDQVGRLLDALEQHGLSDSTIVAVTSDHGDEFMEHGNRYHGRSLYTELVRVPLVIAAPGAAPRTVAQPVSVIDVGPTLLDLVGLDRPAGQNGRSLATAIADGAAPPDRMVLAELIADRNITRNLVAGFEDRWHIIWDLDASTHELYDLASDPGNRRDLAAVEPERLSALKQRLARQVDLELTPLPPPARGKAAKPARPTRPPG